jgi:hypothetical protein
VKLNAGLDSETIKELEGWNASPFPGHHWKQTIIFVLESAGSGLSIARVELSRELWSRVRISDIQLR